MNNSTSNNSNTSNEHHVDNSNINNHHCGSNTSSSPPCAGRGLCLVDVFSFIIMYCRLGFFMCIELSVFVLFISFMWDYLFVVLVQGSIITVKLIIVILVMNMISIMILIVIIVMVILVYIYIYIYISLSIYIYTHAYILYVIYYILYAVLQSTTFCILYTLRLILLILVIMIIISSSSTTTLSVYPHAREAIALQEDEYVRLKDTLHYSTAYHRVSYCSMLHDFITYYNVIQHDIMYVYI